MPFSSKSPTFNLIYFKNVVDLCLVKFFDDYNESFYKNDLGEYVLGESFTKTKLRDVLLLYASHFLEEETEPYDMFKPSYTVVIGSCSPAESILFTSRDKAFPEKLEKLIVENPDIKYLIKEKDIKIDISMLNFAAESVFNDLFAGKKSDVKKLLVKRPNTIFIKHNALDCYSMFKTVKWVLGKSACVSLHKKFKGCKSCIVAVNDLVADSIKDKSKLNGSIYYKKVAAEVKQFLEERLEKMR